MRCDLMMEEHGMRPLYSKFAITMTVLIPAECMVKI